MSRNDSRHLDREAEEVGCTGLLRGVARNLYTHQEFQASACSKADGPFYCSNCRSDAIVHKCHEKIDHFAHIARLSPVLGPHESELHDTCKRTICSLLEGRYPSGKWAVERTIPENKERFIRELRPDISGRVDGQRIAIEIQASALTPTRIAKRSSAYAMRNIPLLWIVPLSQPLGDGPFRPRLYERYLHSIYFGRTYYWWAGLGLIVKPVHYGAATRHVEYREWLEDGQLQTGGDYDAEYKIIKTPFYGLDVCIDTDFVREARTPFTPENERKAVPACTIWRDKLDPWWSDV